MLLPTTVTWVIVANSERCRALEERRRGGVLSELDAWDRQQTEQDRGHGGAEPAVFGPRFAFGRSVVNPRDGEALAERRFLARYAHQLSLAGAKGRYERLILIATPPALGVLREALGRPAQRSVERTATCDCVGEAADTLRARVRALRAPR
jgi:protein required for attachment to host cells